MTLGWALGPRINAAGRIDDSDLGLRLLLCEDPVEAAALAMRLDTVNRQRQDLEAGMMEAAHASAQAQADAGRAVLMVHGEAWHPGVVGIVAGRIKQRQNRPALAGALANGVVKGSGRSVGGVDLGAAVLAARRAGLLLTGGGHAMAAGFSLAMEQMVPFHDFLEAQLAHAADLPRQPDLEIEGSVAVQGANVALAQHVARLAPFGTANEEPLFAVPRARVVRADRIGRDSTTLRLMVEGEGGGPRLKAMLFRGADSELGLALAARNAPVHLAGHLRAEEWNGSVTACFVVSDAAAA
jgi:single-stranded-DNA-specific exonuclease